jgi:hypothetical protein
MLNQADIVAEPIQVVDYADPAVATAMASGKINTDDETLLANIAASIRRGHTQWRGGPVRSERICLVGSGPSLNETADELRRLVWEGAILVTMNGAYHWCIDHGLRPQTQLVMDARATNARFVVPEVPRCNYVLASQCAPEVWDAVEGRPHVWIFHAVVKAAETHPSALLDRYYGWQWIGVGGGTTVATRAINLLRMAGYVRFDLFGIDCCWTGTAHHALPQPENAADQRALVRVGAKDRPETIRQFTVAPWMLKQMEDFLTILKINGQHFTLAVHGDGLLAHLLHSLGTDTDSLIIDKEIP